MQLHQRAQACQLQRHALRLQHLVQLGPQGIAAAVQRVQPLCRQHVLEARQARRHRQHVVVEGASVLPGLRAARVIARHQVCPATEGAKRQAATKVLAQRGQVGADAQLALAAAERQARGHYLIQNQQRARLVGQRSQALQKVRLTGNAAARAQHWLHQDRGQILAMRCHLGAHVFQIVVARHDPFVRHVDGAAALPKGQHPTVVSALEDQHLAPLGHRSGGGQGHQVGFGARIGEAQQLHRRKAALKLARQQAFALGV